MISLYARQLVLIALAAAGCAWLVGNCGPVAAGVVWGVAALVGCGVGTVLLRTSPVGRVNWQNHIAAVLVPWGYRVGGGRLWPIPMVSWAVWMTVWAGAVVLTSWPGADPLTGWEIALRIALGAAWAIDGLALGHTVATLRQHFSAASRSGRTLIPIAAVIAGLIAGSVLLHLLGLTPLALLLAGGPPLLIGGGYALFLAVLLFGRGGRWN